MAVARKKRAHSSSATGTSTQSKHKIGYNASWKTDFRVSIEGPSMAQFNFERAADIWGGMRNRRLSVGHSSSSSSS